MLSPILLAGSVGPRFHLSNIKLFAASRPSVIGPITACMLLGRVFIRRLHIWRVWSWPGPLAPADHERFEPQFRPLPPDQPAAARLVTRPTRPIAPLRVPPLQSADCEAI